jgi:hypothetical protein
METEAVVDKATEPSFMSWLETLTTGEIVFGVILLLVVLCILLRFFGAFIFEFLGEILSALD